jgi:hypothetical protein
MKFRTFQMLKRRILGLDVVEGPLSLTKQNKKKSILLINMAK